MLLHSILLGLALPAPAPAVDQPIEPSAPALMADDKPAEPKWTGAVSAGLTATDGNTNNTSAAVDFGAERKAEKDRWTVKGFWNYAAQENAAGTTEVTQRRIGASLKYDYFLSKKTYLFANIGAESDHKAGIDLRTFLGGGGGYQLYDEENFKMQLEAGLNWFNEEFNAGGSNDYIAGRVAETIGWQIRKDLRFDHSVELFPSVEDIEDFFGKMDNKLRLNLTERMFAQFQWTMNYDNTPASAERMDNLYALTVGWSF